MWVSMFPETQTKACKSEADLSECLAETKLLTENGYHGLPIINMEVLNYHLLVAYILFLLL